MASLNLFDFVAYFVFEDDLPSFHFLIKDFFSLFLWFGTHSGTKVLLLINEKIKNFELLDKHLDKISK